MTNNTSQNRHQNKDSTPLLKVAFTAIMMTTCLMGCSTSKSDPNFYLLSSAPISGEINSAKRIGLLAIELPAYARQDKIASLSGAHTIRLDDNNRWAEPAEAAVSNALIGELSRQSGAFVAMRPFPRALNPGHQVKVVFTKFVRAQDGSAVMEGQYFILQGRDETINSLDQFSITVAGPSHASGDSGSGTGYDGYMDAASQGLAQLAGEILQKIGGQTRSF